MILLSLSGAFALDCTGLDADSCNATNDVIAQINLEAADTVVGDTQSGRFGSTSIYNRIDAINQAVQAEGCDAISGTWGGTYDMTTRSWEGVWASGADGGDASGDIDLKGRRWTGSFTGDATGQVGDAFAGFDLTNLRNGAIAGSQGEGFLAGYWLRVAGNVGVYYAVTGTCPAPALDGWLGRPVPSPTAVDATMTVLGTGTANLLGGDLTDPENDGDELAGEADPSWNWVDAFANDEPGFQGGEFSFNVFDNVLGSGNAKWCCSAVNPEDPNHVGFELASPVRLTHFTISSANDVVSRDPNWWHIEGSNDGSTWFPIYVQKDTAAVWNARLQVVLFELDEPAPPYRFFRYNAFRTLGGGSHQLGELELFAD